MKNMTRVMKFNVVAPHAAEYNEVTKPAVSADFHSLIHNLRSLDVSKAELALKKASGAGFVQATFALTLLNYYGLAEGKLTAVLRYSSKAAYAYHVPSMYVLGSVLHTIQRPHRVGDLWLQMATILDPMGKCSHNLLDPGEVEDEVLIEDIIDALKAPQVIFDPKKAAASAKRLSIPMPKSGKFVKLNGQPEPWEAFQDYSPELGFKMVHQAAEDGYITALYHVSSMFRRGYGTDPDPDLADAWFYAARKLDVDNKGLHMVNITLN